MQSRRGSVYELPRGMAESNRAVSVTDSDAQAEIAASGGSDNNRGLVGWARNGCTRISGINTPCDGGSRGRSDAQLVGLQRARAAGRIKRNNAVTRRVDLLAERAGTAATVCIGHRQVHHEAPRDFRDRDVYGLRIGSGRRCRVAVIGDRPGVIRHTVRTFVGIRSVGNDRRIQVGNPARWEWINGQNHIIAGEIIRALALILDGEAQHSRARSIGQIDCNGQIGASSPA